ncbi:MAG TPA: guanylate kinase [Rickettsiales bacterium]|nr:guanylate kinase [Rickettsiales bacterium]
MLPYEHFLIILSSPSGTGKTTLAKMLLDKYNNIKLSTSATTRKPRNGEIDGFHYYFLNQEDFDKKIKNNEFLEYAGVYGSSYGTLKSQIEDKFDEGNDVLLDIDWQGNLSVSKEIKDKSKIVRIFLLPPSVSELENRLNSRGTDSKEVIEKRMADARNTMSHYKEYDYVVVNDSLEVAFEELCGIIDSKRLENVKKNELEKFVKELMEE